MNMTLTKRDLFGVKHLLLVPLLNSTVLSPFLSFFLVKWINFIDVILMTSQEMINVQIKIRCHHQSLFALCFLARIWMISTDILSVLVGVFTAILVLPLVIPWFVFDKMLKIILLLPETLFRNWIDQGLRLMVECLSTILLYCGFTTTMFCLGDCNLFDQLFNVSVRMGLALECLNEHLTIYDHRLNAMDLENGQRLIKMSVSDGLDENIDEQHIHALIGDYCGVMSESEWKLIKQRLMDKNEKKDVLSDPRWDIHIGQGRLNYLMRNGLRFQWALMERDLFIPLRLAYLRKTYPSFIYQWIRLYYSTQWSLFLICLFIRDLIFDVTSLINLERFEIEKFIPQTIRKLVSRKPRKDL